VQCNQCGEDIARGQSNVRRLETGKNARGGAHFREVNLCGKCLGAMDARNRGQRMTRAVIAVLAILAVAASAYYYFYLRE
jgi:hypothetical protein